MQTTAGVPPVEPARPLDAESPNADSTKYRVLCIISLAHLLNDATQSLLAPAYPMFKEKFSLTFTQIGVITLVYQVTASLLQPLIGRYTDKHPMPYSLPIGMAFTTSGLLLMSMAPTYPMLLVGAMLLGTGSSTFHPESSRIARMASGGRYGLAQSIFQVGGNAGSSCGPLLAAAVIIPNGQGSMAWFVVMPLLAMALLLHIGGWAKRELARPSPAAAARKDGPVPRSVVVRAFAVLMTLIFSKYFYMASITSFFIFFLMGKFGISQQAAQIRLFVFLAATAAGTLIGGPVGDRIGRKYVIWASILGVTPFTLALPYLDLFWTTVFIFIIGLVMASAFSAIVVFAQELVPGRTGLVAGLFFGLMFGMGGVAAAALGKLADLHGIDFVYHVCAYLPLLGATAAFLPNLKETREEKRKR